MIQQAVILAGGLGTRLGPLVKSTPKPMMLITGKPFLEYLLLYLSRQGISEFVFCVGYLGEQVQDYFKNGKTWRTSILYSTEETPLGTGGAIKKAKSLLAPHFILLNGDNFLKFDFAALTKAYESSPASAVGMVTCWPNASTRFQSNLSLSPDEKKVSSYDYFNPAGKTHIDAGVKIFSRKLLTFFDTRDIFSLEADIMPVLARKKLLNAYPVSNPPLDIGTPTELERTKQELLQTNPLFDVKR